MRAHDGRAENAAARSGDDLDESIGLLLGDGAVVAGEGLVQNGDGAMINAGWNHPKACVLSNVSHDFRRGIGGDINIRHGDPQQRIAHRAADKQRLMARHGQGRAQRLRARVVKPSAVNLHHSALSANPRKIRAVAPQM